MKTALNPFENAKRTANGTGGGVSPAVIEEMQGEISILGSQNETQAQDIIDIKGSLNSINDNLSKNTISDNTKVTLTYDIEYTTLSDGYFKIYAELGQNRTTGYVNNVSLISIASLSTDYCMSSILVRKGSKIKFNGTSSTASAGIFYPLS